MRLKELNSYVELFSEYTELRVQENRNLNVTMVNGNITQNHITSNSGLSARVYKNGVFGFASNPNISDETAKLVIKSATDNAIFLNKREGRLVEKLVSSPAVSENDFSTKKNRVSQQVIVEFIKTVDDYIQKKCPNIISRSIVLSLLDMEKSLITSDKSIAYSMIPRTILFIVLTTQKQNIPIELFDVYGGFGQFEDHFSPQENIFNGLMTQYEHLMKKKDGIYAAAGFKECILDADLAGILAHEAIGHTTEADLVLAGSVASNYLNEEVSSPLITLVDYANTANGRLCPVPVYIDDEGTKAEDTIIIDKGVLKNYMHNKETADHFNTKPNGNARAYQFSDEPLIRMRNTAIVPGKSKLNDMISSIDDGYYLMKASNGQADSTSEFMFGVVLGYEIINGKIRRALRNTTISGIAFDVLKSVSMVSDDMVWSNGGMCGKKQLIPVGMGGPAIKCKLNIGGR